MSLRGSTSWTKMTSLGGKLTALVCCPAKYVNKAEKKRTFLSANIEVYDNEITSLINIYFYE